MSRIDVADLMWASADGKERKVCDLELNHFVNVLNWINEADMKYPQTFINHMERHAYDRAFIALADSKPYPHKEDGTWMIIDDKMHQADPPPAEYIDFIKEKYGVDNPHAIAQAIARSKEIDKT